MKRIVDLFKNLFKKKDVGSDWEDTDQTSPTIPQPPGSLDEYENEPTITRTLKNLKFKSKKPSALTSFLGRGGNTDGIEKFSRALFDPSSRPNIHKTFTKIFVIALAYGIGKSVAIYLTPASKAQAPLNISLPRPGNFENDANKIKLANLFRTKADLNPTPDKPKTKTIRENVLCLASNKSSSLPVKLLHTTVMQDSVKSVASVQVRGKLVSLREGDKIESLAKVGSIKSLKLIFKNLQSGQCEHVEGPRVGGKASSRPLNVVSPEQGRDLINNKKVKGIKNEGNNFNICKSFMDKKMQNLGDILTQAKADPFPNPDGTLSFKISQIAPGGIFSHLGIEIGDIITRINGNKINNIQEIMQLFGGISSITNLQLSVERDGSEVNLDYNFDARKNCENEQ